MTNRRADLVDTHAHLDDDQFQGDIECVLERANAAGVRRVINIGYRPARWSSTLALAKRFPSISMAFGLHPHHCQEWSDDVEVRLIELLRRHKPVALGEIGLDYFRNANPPDLQRRVFERQLELASELGLPVVIHQRHAEQDLIAILSNAPSDLVCVLHSFEGTAELAEFGLQRGYVVGVGGLMTRNAAADLRTVLKSIPPHKMLLETDSPCLTPAGVKPRRNEPANLVLVADRLANLLDLDATELASLCTRNAEIVFGLSHAPALTLDAGESATR